MKCPRCESDHIRNNGRQRGKQNYICVNCKHQFIESYDQKGYTEDIKSEWLEMYVNQSGFRAIERVKKVQTLADSLTLPYHTTVINCVKQMGSILPDTPYRSEIPEVTLI